jgi:hypothetical protein
MGMLSGCGQKAADKAAEEMSWTATEWESASADEKKACALAYTEYVAKETGINNVKEQIENMGDDELNAVVATLDTLFKSSGEQSLQEVMDVMFKKPS